MTSLAGGLRVAAVPLIPPEGGKCWAFHPLNDSPERIDAVLVESVGYEWGGMGNESASDRRAGPLPPGGTAEFWRDDDHAAELRISLQLVVRGSAGERRWSAEFGKLYQRKPARIPGLRKDGVAGEIEAGALLEPPLRAWHCSGGYLVDRGPQSAVSSLMGELPKHRPELREYARLDLRSAGQEEYRFSTWSLDDDLGCSGYDVFKGALYQRTIVEHTGGSPRVGREEARVLADLREVAADDVATRNLLWDALAARRRLQEQQAAQAASDGDARVAAIAGAAEDFGLGKNFLRAQEVLRDRIRLYGGDLDAVLLRALVRFGREGRAVQAAAEQLALACRRAAFDATVEREKPATAAGAPGSTELTAMLDDVHRRLLEAAESQELSDAMMNAAEFTKAAAHVARARELLGGGK